ncbi:hypothetical protein KIN20_026996 [Parelaphostrongylus tenuis]|uniref:Battenin n=1 Tax=Parelaphostrongylus tenuis TaxID=148309 RepID=A0AAD5QZ14_PARTN|nr:hypothetical protein KIN20_026996 [Parelaphostrongylus tenuis]
MPQRFARATRRDDESARGDGGPSPSPQNRYLSSRNLAGFWVLGLCNNFAYVVMLSAAKDILETDSSGKAQNVTHACRPSDFHGPKSACLTGNSRLQFPACERLQLLHCERIPRRWSHCLFHSSLSSIGWKLDAVVGTNWLSTHGPMAQEKMLAKQRTRLMEPGAMMRLQKARYEQLVYQNVRKKLRDRMASKSFSLNYFWRKLLIDIVKKLSTGAVLLADIVPALLVKVSAPLYIHRVPFGLRHTIVVMAQILSLILVAISNDVSLSLLGVVITSLGSGLGEVSYLALASYFDARVISMWSSGTGGAGIIGAITYAVLTDRLMLHFSPQAALYGMLIVPLVFGYTFWFVLELPNSIHKISVCDPTTYLVPSSRGHVTLERQLLDSSDSYTARPLLDEDTEYENGNFMNRSQRSLSLRQKIRAVLPLLKYMVPLVVVYFSEYFINQGLLELLEFDCTRGFGLTPASQYRWYQVLYQVGVFISRSSSDCIALPGEALPVLAMLQVLNATIFYFEAITRFISHILLLMCLIVYEGLLGGAAYVNTFKVIHEEVPADRKEFSLGFVSISDTFGILLAGFTAIPVHNIICERPL